MNLTHLSIASIVVCLALVACGKKPERIDSIRVSNFSEKPVYVSFCADRAFSGRQDDRKARIRVLCSGYYKLGLDDEFRLVADNGGQKLYVRVSRSGQSFEFNGDFESERFMVAFQKDFTVEQHSADPAMKKLYSGKIFGIWDENEINWISSNPVPQGWDFVRMIRASDGSTHLRISPGS